MLPVNFQTAYGEDEVIPLANGCEFNKTKNSIIHDSGPGSENSCTCLEKKTDEKKVKK